MTPNPRIVALVLAAGEGRRFGTAKQLQEIAGEAMLRRVVGAASALQLETLIVLGARADQIRPMLKDCDAILIEHEGWAEGIGSSIAFGVNHTLASGPAPEGILILLADQALIEAEDLQKLIEAFEHTPERIIASEYEETLGAPCIFPASFFGELAQLSVDRGAKSVLKKNLDQVTAVRMPRAAIDIDTPEDLKRAARILRSS